MNFAELSAQRYSLRKFSDRPVEDALLRQVLEAGRNAPTAHNNQPQRIFVLQSPEAMAKADACMGCHFHPPVLLAVAYDPAAAPTWPAPSPPSCWSRHRVKKYPLPV